MGLAAQAKRAKSGQHSLSIGQVLAKLVGDFPDLTPSKLRFLEEQDLIQPARTHSGYRKFSSDDTDRLRLILTLQRDQYLPLKVIRTYLEELDSGARQSLPGFGAVIGTLKNQQVFTREELIAAAAAREQLFDEAVSTSLIKAGETYDRQALSMLQALGQLREFGIEPRHLRSVRAAVARELGLIDSALKASTRSNDASGPARAKDSAHQIANGLAGVREALMAIGLENLSE